MTHSMLFWGTIYMQTQQGMKRNFNSVTLLFLINIMVLLVFPQTYLNWLQHYAVYKLV